MTNNQFSNPDGKHVFDLEKRTVNFSKEVILLCKQLSRSPMNDRLVGQLVGSSGSVGANYREANDALGKKDFTQRLKISRREAKETFYWLELVVVANPDYEKQVSVLLKEATELRNILSAIIKKVDTVVED